MPDSISSSPCPSPVQFHSASISTIPSDQKKTVAPKRFGMVSRAAMEAFKQALNKLSAWLGNQRGLATRFDHDIEQLADSSVFIPASDSGMAELPLDHLMKFGNSYSYFADVSQATLALVASSLPDIGTAQGQEENLSAYFSGFQSAFAGENDKAAPATPAASVEALCESLQRIAASNLPFDDRLRDALRTLTEWCGVDPNMNLSNLPALALKTKLESALVKIDPTAAKRKTFKEGSRAHAEAIDRLPVQINLAVVNARIRAIEAEIFQLWHEPTGGIKGITCNRWQPEMQQLETQRRLLMVERDRLADAAGEKASAATTDVVNKDWTQEFAAIRRTNGRPQSTWKPGGKEREHLRGFSDQDGILRRWNPSQNLATNGADGAVSLLWRRAAPNPCFSVAEDHAMKTSFNPNVPPAVRLDAADSSAAPTVAPKRFGVLRREAKDAYIQALTDYAIWFDKKGLETRLGTDVAALAASRLLASASDGLTTELTLDDLRTLRDFHPEDADVVQTTVNLVASTLPEIGTARGGEEDLGAYIREFQSTFDFVNDRGRPSVPTPFSEHLCPSLRSIAGCDWPFDAKLTSLLQQLSDWCREPRNREWPEYLPALALHARLQAAIGSRHEADTEHGDSRALFAPDTGLSKPAAPAARPTLVQKNRDILNKRIAVNESRISWLSYLQRPTRMTPDQANDLRDKIQVLTAQRGVLSRDLANLDTPMRARDSRPQPETPEAPAAGSREPTAVPRSPSRLEGITNPDTAREKTCDQTPQTIRDQRSRPDPDAVLQANLAKIRIRKAGSSAPATRSPKPDE